MSNNSGSHEPVSVPMNGRDRWRQKTAQPLTLGDVMKMLGAGMSLVVIVGGGFGAYFTFKAEAQLTDATTIEKLRALERKHDIEHLASQEKHSKDWELTRSALQEFDHDLHELDKRQGIMEIEQRHQTDLLKEIRAEVKRSP